MENKIIPQLEDMNISRNEYNVYYYHNRLKGKTYITLNDNNYSYAIYYNNGGELKHNTVYDFQQLMKEINNF